MRRIAITTIALATLLLAGCNRHDVKPDLPGAGTVVKPQIVYVDRYVYVSIKDDLTQEEPIAEGPLSQCPIVAAARKTALKRINGRMRQIDAIQGTPVKP